MAGKIPTAPGWDKITRVCENERKRKRESYIQNSWDKAELSDLAVAMAGAYERSRKSGKEDQEGGVQVVTCKFEP